LLIPRTQLQQHVVFKQQTMPVEATLQCSNMHRCQQCTARLLNKNVQGLISLRQKSAAAQSRDKQQKSSLVLLAELNSNNKKSSVETSSVAPPGGEAEPLILPKLTHSLEVLLEVLPVDLTGQEGRFGNLALLSEGDGAHQHPQLTLSQVVPQ